MGLPRLRQVVPDNSEVLEKIPVPCHRYIYTELLLSLTCLVCIGHELGGVGYLGGGNLRLILSNISLSHSSICFLLAEAVLYLKYLQTALLVSSIFFTSPPMSRRPSYAASTTYTFGCGPSHMYVTSPTERGVWVIKPWFDLMSKADAFTHHI